MTRRGSRTEGRQPAGRPAAAYITDPIPPDSPVMVCACGASYRDHPDSHTAHHAVYGHRPIRKPAPATAESAPQQHQEGAAER